MDFVAFNEGKSYILDNDVIGATMTFALSSLSCPADVNAPGAGEHDPTDTFAGGYGLVTYWTGGANNTQVIPSPTDGVISFAQEDWDTGVNTDGPASVKSVVGYIGSTLICAWNLATGGTARDFSGANTTLAFTPDLFLANVGES